MKKDYKEALIFTINSIMSDTIIMTKVGATYYDIFPESTKKGIIGFHDEDRKKIIMGYYNYAIALSEQIAKVETALSKLHSIMLSADKEQDTEIIVVCDHIITQYELLKKHLTSFVERSELIIKKSEGNAISAKMLHAHMDFTYQIKIFLDNLKNINITV